MGNFAIIGLGNPGQVYQKTRHNLGFWLVDAIAEKENLVFQSSKDFHADHLVMSRKDNRILLVNVEGNLQFGHPYLSNSKIEGQIMEHLRGSKVIVYKMKSKKKYRRKKGHRQEMTKVLINKIGVSNGS